MLQKTKQICSLKNKNQSDLHTSCKHIIDEERNIYKLKTPTLYSCPAQPGTAAKNQALPTCSYSVCNQAHQLGRVNVLSVHASTISEAERDAAHESDTGDMCKKYTLLNCQVCLLTSGWGSIMGGSPKLRRESDMAYMGTHRHSGRYHHVKNGHPN